MIYRELGKTGMQVSAIGFGASSLGGVFHDFEEAKGIDAVFAAIDAGINFIDVSPYYGYYKAETVLGKALKDIPRDKFFLSTKVGRYGESAACMRAWSACTSIISISSMSMTSSSRTSGRWPLRRFRRW
jgi:aryl-alcohol dehydrogenase-like predicted oxidoreductase